MKVLTFKNDTVSVGDVFVSSWGYEQTNVTFYQVIDRNLNLKKIKKTPENRYLFRTLCAPCERLRLLNGAH
jgi:hypothetical protein